MANNIVLANVLNEIKNNSKVTQQQLAKKYNLHERTIRRYFKILKDDNIIYYSVNQKKWETTKK